MGFLPYCSFVFLPLVLPCCFVALCDFPGSSAFLKVCLAQSRRVFGFGFSQIIGIFFLDEGALLDRSVGRVKVEGGEGKKRWMNGFDTKNCESWGLRFHYICLRILLDMT